MLEMIQEDTLRERVARLETKVDHLSDSLEKAVKKVDEMHGVMMQAKGARWVLIAAASIAGALAGFAAKFTGLIGGLPR
ncbi:MAG: hypothetical protein WC100_19345 [Sterolibacterium sp.]